MGLGGGFLAQLIELKQSRALDGVHRVVEIGAQQLADCFLSDDKALDEAYRVFGRPRVALGAPVGFANYSEQAPPSEPFWQSLGLEYTAIDYSSDRGAIPLDLNRGKVPWRMRGKYDLVVNAGTTEHVANQGSAFKVIHDLARPDGGVMLHDVPSVGLIPHGLISYDIKWFWCLCRANSYQVIRLGMNLAETRRLHPDIHATNAEFGMRALDPTLEMPVMGITAALRRVSKAPFQIPLDVAVA